MEVVGRSPRWRVTRASTPTAAPSFLASLDAVLAEIALQVLPVEDDASADPVVGQGPLANQRAHHEHRDAQDGRRLLDGQPPAIRVPVPFLRHQLCPPWAIELA